MISCSLFYYVLSLFDYDEINNIAVINDKPYKLFFSKSLNMS